MPVGSVCKLYGEQEGPPIFSCFSISKKIITGFNIFLWLELEGDQVL